MQRLLPLLIGFLVLSMPVQAAERHAFVVGVNQYANVTPLNNAVADAASMAELLKKLGYHTTLVAEEKAGRSSLIAEFGRFLSGLHPGDEVVVFYSGHGVEVQHDNYLVPKDVERPDDIGEESSLPILLISFDYLMKQVSEKTNNATNIWIIDACRDNPFVRSGKQFGAAGGLSQVSSGEGTFIFYSAGYGAKARDGLPNDPPSEKNGVYTRVFLKLVEERKNEDVVLLAKEARARVYDLTDKWQSPAYYDGLNGPWCFASCQTQPSVRLETTQASISNPTDVQMRTATNTTAAPTTPTADPPNVVYLGKKSVVENCEKVNVDQHPFGCEALIKAAGDRAARAALLTNSQTALTAVYLRLRAPTMERQGPVYPCAIRTLKSGDAVRFTGIIDVIGPGDTYYWGAVEGEPQKCGSARAPG